MDYCVCIQCFNKPIETLLVLNSLEKNANLKKIHLLLYVDKAENKTKSYKKNIELIDKLISYKNEKDCLFKSLTLIMSDINLGPYKCCYLTIENGFTLSNNVIFSEDDILFCKDTINYFIAYFNNKIKNVDINHEDCLGITSSSIYFGFTKKTSFTINEKDIIVNNLFSDKIKNIKEKIKNNGSINSCQKINWAPNKQFALLKHNWNKISFFRTDNYILDTKLNTKAPDHATGEFVNNNNMYFIYSYIPRSNDIGLYYELGCTTLYYNDFPSCNTIKYLTTDDFNIISCNYELHHKFEININID